MQLRKELCLSPFRKRYTIFFAIATEHLLYSLFAIMNLFNMGDVQNTALMGSSSTFYNRSEVLSIKQVSQSWRKYTCQEVQNAQQTGKRNHVSKQFVL